MRVTYPLDCDTGSTLDLLEFHLRASVPSEWVLDVDYVGGGLANDRRSKENDGDGGSPALHRLVVRADGRTLHLARLPSAEPGDGDLPCPECFDRRCIAWFTADAQWAIASGHGLEAGPKRGPMRALLTPATLKLAGLLASRLTSGNECHPAAVLSLDLLTREVGSAELLPDPFCSCVGAGVGTAPPPPLVLRDSLPAPLGDMRLKRLGDYALPLRALINPVCGAVGRGHIPGYVQTITAPVFGQYWQREANSKPRSVGWSGLCLRRTDSERVGILEALERQGGMQPPPIATAATLRELGDLAMDPTLCLAYNEESYTRPLGLIRFDADVRCNWIWGHSLQRRRPVLVSAALAFYHRPGASESVKLVDNNSSGCAMGSCVEEALLKSLLELIERDAFAISWLRMLGLPKINPASIADVRIQMLIGRLDYLGIDVSLLDARLDIDVPVIVAVARRRDQEIGSMAIGASAHISPVEAIRGALLEVATSITELPALVRHNEAHVMALAKDPYRVTTVMDHQTLYGLPSMAAQTRWMDASPVMHSLAEAYPDWRSDEAIDISAEVARLHRTLIGVGIADVVMVEMTAREQRLLGLRTVRAIAPGLAPIDFGHPRNRVESLPRLWSAPAAAGFPADRSARLNTSAHPFP